MNHAFRSALAIVTLGLALAACSAGGATSAPSEPPPSEVAGRLRRPGHRRPGARWRRARRSRSPASRTSIPSRSSGSTRPRPARRSASTRYWTSGVDPCYVLDQVQVDTNDNDMTVDVTVDRGHVGSGRDLRDDGRAQAHDLLVRGPLRGHVDDPRLAGWCAAGRGRGLVTSHAPSLSGRPQGACATIRR